MKRRLMRLVAPLMRKMMDEPSCQEVNQFLADYVEDNLDADVSDRYRKHVAHCDCCKAYLDQYQGTIDLLHDCRNCDLPDDLVEHTLEFLKERGVTA
ncbi:MAG: hypothetical protein HKN29_03865 [Rhodothermales bacterium]|nr:hypothetical protein [Rhodothermales bacterium]